MKRVFSICLMGYLFIGLFSSLANAQSSTLSGTLKTEVVGQVGELYLNLSGLASAFASIALSSDGSFMTSVVADENGNFSISNILIKRGFSNFCLTVVDFKRAGESTTCFSFSPAVDSITMKDLFLPPTLGLSSTTTDFNSTVFAFGYTLPGSKVTFYFSNGRQMVTVADTKGYYNFKITKLTPGNYNVYTGAEDKSKKSLTPTKKTQLRSLSIAEKAKGGLEGFVDKAKKLFTSITFWFVLLVIALIILIIILIIKLKSRFRSSAISQSNPKTSIPHAIGEDNKKLLHHWWWVGY